MDRLFRVTFSAKPLLLHACSMDQAKERALQYAVQPGAKQRIVIEEAEKDATK